MCRWGLRGFDAAYCFGSYESALRKLIHLYKYSGIRSAGASLAEMLNRAIPESEYFDAVYSRSAALAAPVGAGLQSVRIAGRAAGIGERNSGGSGTRTGARHPGTGRIEQQREAPQRGRGFSLPCGRIAFR